MPDLCPREILGGWEVRELLACDNNVTGPAIPLDSGVGHDFGGLGTLVGIAQATPSVYSLRAWTNCTASKYLGSLRTISNPVSINHSP